MTSAFLKITNRSFVRVDDSIFHNFLHFSSLLGLTGSLILLREPFADADCWACWIRIVDLKTTLIPNRSKKYSHRPNGENWKIPISSSLARIWWLSLLVFPPPITNEIELVNAGKNGPLRDWKCEQETKGLWHRRRKAGRGSFGGGRFYLGTQTSRGSRDLIYLAPS